MSLEVHTYVPTVDESVIPRWLARMRELGMTCESILVSLSQCIRVSCLSSFRFRTPRTQI